MKEEPTAEMSDTFLVHGDILVNEIPQMRQTEIPSSAYRKARQLFRGDKVREFYRLLGREKGRGFAVWDFWK